MPLDYTDRDIISYLPSKVEVSGKETAPILRNIYLDDLHSLHHAEDGLDARNDRRIQTAVYWDYYGCYPDYAARRRDYLRIRCVRSSVSICDQALYQSREN